MFSRANGQVNKWTVGQMDSRANGIFPVHRGIRDAPQGNGNVFRLV